MPFLAPVFAAIGAAIAASPVLGFVVKLGTSLLLSAAASALTKKPSFAASPSARIEGRDITIREAVAPCEIVYGRSRKGGVIVFMHSRQTPGSETLNELHLIIVLASHQVAGIGGIYFDGELAIAGNEWQSSGRYLGGAAVERALGGPGQTAFPALAEMLPDLWTAQHQLRGQAAIWLRLFFNPDLFPSGIPNITAEIAGKNDILDPRTGLRGYSENPALCLADYMSLPAYGIGAAIGAADGINEADLIASANVCDEPVPLAGGGIEPRYTCNGVVSLADSPQGIIEGMLTAMAGSCAYAGGQWSIHAGYYRVPTVTLTADDVREGGLTLTTRQSRANNFNAVRGTFISPENDWVPDDFPAYVSPTYVAEDGGEVTYSDITLPFTISAATAQRLAKIELERQRRQMTVAFAGKLGAWRVGVGDTVMVTYSRWGLADKPFEVSGLSMDLEGGDGGVQMLPALTLRETSPLIWDWSATEQQVYAAAPRTTLPRAFDIDPPASPDAAESLYETRGGVRTLVQLTWGRSPSPFVATYQVEGALNGGAFAFLGRTDALMLEVLDIAAGRWVFRVKAISQTGVSSGWVQTEREVYGLGLPPVALTGVSAQVANGLVLLQWDQSPDLDVRIGGRIDIRHSTAAVPTIAATYSLPSVPGAAAQALVSQLPGTYFLRAVDSSGMPGPAVSVAVTGNTALEFAPITTLQADPTFGGTKVTTEVVSSTLKLSTLAPVSSWNPVSAVSRVGAAGGFAPEGRYDFATGMNLGSVRRVRLRSQIDVLSENPADQISTRFGNVSSWERVSGTGGGEVDVVLEVRTTQTDPGGSPVWSGWMRLDSNELQAWGVQARAFLRTRDASFTPAVSTLRVQADEVA